MAKKALRKHNQGEDEVHLIHYCAMKFAVILTVNLNKNKKLSTGVPICSYCMERNKNVK